MKQRTMKLTSQQAATGRPDRLPFAPLIRSCTQPSLAEPSPAPPGATPAPGPDSFIPWFQKRTRNGKIARLPRVQRDVVNHMLFNNIPLKQIVTALEELGGTVTERNISNWKTRGGYREWCLAQNQAIQLRLHQDNLSVLVRKDHPSELSEVGLQAAAAQLSQFFLSSQSTQLLDSDPEEYGRRLSLLARVSTHLKALQKYRDDCGKSIYKNPERLLHEAKQDAETVRRICSSDIPDEPEGQATPHRNYLPAT